DEFLERFDFAVLNQKTNTFEPYVFSGQALDTPVLSASSNPSFVDIKNIVDKNTKTYTDIHLPENGRGRVSINLISQKAISASSLSVLLEDNVALPNSIEISALISGQKRVVLAESEMESQTVRFPETFSNNWTISFSFSQPLRISEIKLNENVSNKTVVNKLRFLAQPETNYLV